MPRIQPNTKAELANLYNVSSHTIYRWLKALVENCERFADEREDKDYLCFKEYKTRQKLFTPLQMQVFKKHHGEP